MKSFLATLALCLPMQAFANGYSFAPLRDIGYENDTYPVGISDNGQRVYGYTFVGGPTAVNWGGVPQAQDLFLWDNSSGYSLLSSLPVSDNQLVPTAISGDGTVVMGYTGSGILTDYNFKWTHSGGYSTLPWDSLPSSSRLRPIAASYDGSIITGHFREPFGTWTGFIVANGQISTFRVPNTDDTPVYVSDISNAGDIIVGKTKLNGHLEAAFVWTPLTGFIRLEPLDELHNMGEAVAISANGEYVLAQAYFSLNPNDQEWFIWNESNGTMPISTQDGFYGMNFTAMSDNGLVVGSASPVLFGLSRAALWDQTNGLQYLHEILEANDIDLLGWKLMGITDVTPDGQTLVGYGQTPDGRIDAFIATIPEPLATLWLLPLGLIALVCYRRTK